MNEKKQQNFVIDPASMKGWEDQFDGASYPPLASEEEMSLLHKHFQGTLVPEMNGRGDASQPFTSPNEWLEFNSSFTTKRPPPKQLDDSWIQTYTGKKFYPLNPNVEGICLKDIAHALSLQCRFTGHCKFHYCVTPDTRVLTSDLIWKPAGDLEPFEGLVAFEEYPVKIHHNNRNRRKIVYSNVLNTGIIKRHVFALHLSDGTILKSSEEHPWLICSKKSRNQKWETTAEIIKAIQNGKQRFMLKFLEPWTENVKNDYAIGYLSGITDGEGCVTSHRKYFNVSISQNPGPVLNKIKDHLSKFDFKYSEYIHDDCRVISIRGQWYEKLRFLGLVKSIRLTENYKNGLRAGEFKKEFDSISMVSIDKIEDLGMQNVVALETSSRTYFAEGFGAHNSIAQHSVLVSLHCDPQYALQGLLHDASEAYICDLAAPLKRSGQFEEYKRIENRLQAAIFRKFGLSPIEPTQVKQTDVRMLATESRDVMGSKHPDWHLDVQPYDFTIQSCSPRTAEHHFLYRFYQLTDI